MALQLNREMTTGVSANYWSISEIKIKGDKLQVRLDLHISKLLKDAGKTAIETRMVTVDCTKAELIAGNVYELAYNAIKASSIVEEGDVETNEFVAAIDC